MAGMKLQQFRTRTLLLLTAIMGVVFAVCAKWPVTEGPRHVPVRHSGSTIYHVISESIRPPTPSEFAVRAALFSLVIVAAFAIVGLLRRWYAHRKLFP